METFLEPLIGKIENEIITTIYGPGGSGKTLACMLEAIKVAKTDKVLYIDTEGGFSVERFKQVAGEDYEKLLDNIIFLKPYSFAQQKDVFDKLKEHITQKVKLIIVDTIAMLYRLELGKNEEVYETNRELGRQLSSLTEIARKHAIPILITNQVYSNLDSSNGVKMVGGDMLVYGSKCLIELQKGREGKRIALLRKHRSMPEKTIMFAIESAGVRNFSE